MRRTLQSLLSWMVRAVGIEPTLLSERDFESRASTNSTTPAQAGDAPLTTHRPALQDSAEDALQIAVGIFGIGAEPVGAARSVGAVPDDQYDPAEDRNQAEQQPPA